MRQPFLDGVTLCAATSVNVTATVAALRASLAHVNFADCILFTDADVPDDTTGIRVVSIPRLTSAKAYSEFILRDLAHHIVTEHCMIVQWDGFVIDGACWRPEFLAFDYVGAVWPQFEDGSSVGNGGFSLRSRRLLEACHDPSFQVAHPEDVAICRLNRPLLEEHYGIQFAPRVVADRFSFERNRSSSPTFGFHGVFNMIPLLGADRFWDLYRTLDARRGAEVDLGLLIRQLGGSRGSLGRRLRLLSDRLRAARV